MSNPHKIFWKFLQTLINKCRDIFCGATSSYLYDIVKKYGQMILLSHSHRIEKMNHILNLCVILMDYMIFSFHISMKKLNDSYLYWWILLRFPKSSDLGKRRIFTSTSSLLQVEKIDMQTVSLIQSLIVGIRILILNHSSKLIIHLSTIVWGYFLDTDKKHLVGIANFNFHCSFKDFNFFFSVIVIATFSALIILLYLCTRLWFRKYNKTSTKKNTSNMVKLKRFLRQ